MDFRGDVKSLGATDSAELEMFIKADAFRISRRI
jgi:hypothetical protein